MITDIHMSNMNFYFLFIYLFIYLFFLNELYCHLSVVSCLDATECTGAAGSHCRGSLNIVYLLLFCVFIICIISIIVCIYLFTALSLIT